MAAGDRKPGSNRGRPTINWAEAFLFYAGLPPERRTYQAVSDAYPSVSVRTVERHGCNEAWQERAKQLDLEAATAAAVQLRSARAEKLIDLDRLIDATEVTYANQLRDGRVRVAPADLARMHKLRTELWAASDDATLKSNAVAVSATPAAVDPAERKLQVVRALRDAGALVELLGLNHDSPGDRGSDDPTDASLADQPNAEPNADKDDE